MQSIGKLEDGWEMAAGARLPQIISRSDCPDALGQSDCNCDCACPLPAASLLSPVSSFLVPSKDLESGTSLNEALRLGGNIFFSSVEKNRLVIPNDLYIAPLEDDYYIAFNPLAENGQVVVINSVTFNILQLFHADRVVDEIIPLAVEMDIEPAAAKSAIYELYRLSILVSQDWKPSSISGPTDTLVAWLHTTNECNLRCTYCYLNKTPDSMTPEVGKKAVDAIFRSARVHDFKAVKLKFAGGEATLNFDLVVHLYDYAEFIAKQSNLRLEAVVLSNGVGITHQMADAIVQRGMRLMISLDGLARYNDAQRIFANGKGSFVIVSRTLDRLLGRGIVPEISITITDRNIDGLPDLLRYVLQRNMPFSLNFYRENDCSSTFEELRYSDERMIAGMEAAYRVIEELLPERSLLGAIVDRANFTRPHNKTCGVGDNYVVIDERGNVAKCQMAIKDTIGTVDAPDVVALVREDQIGIQNLPVQEKEGCRNCTWRNWCTGGCSLYTYRVMGRYDVKSPNCRIYKAIYPQVLRLEGLRILRRVQRDGTV